MDRLAEMPLGRRAYWLSVPLSNLGADRWKEPGRAVLRELGDQLGLPPTRPTDAVWAARAAQAAQIEQLIPAPFAPQRVTPAEQIWLRNHAMRRGMIDLPIPQPGDTVEELLTSSAGMVEPILDEGGRTDPEPPHRLDLLGQRFLKVTDAAGADQFDMPASYQVMLALAETPAGGLSFPGSEVLFDLDRTGIDVDWAIRLRVNSRPKVLARNRAAVRGINEQFDQRAAEETTGLHDLGLALELLTEYDELFANDKLEVEIEHVVMLAIGVAAHTEGQTPAALRALVDEQAKALTQHLVNNAGMKFERMPAKQEQLWWQMLPGAPRDEKILRAYRQFTSSRHFAKLVPFIAFRLGGDSGPVLMVDKEMSRPHPVHIDLAGYPELDLSGSIQIVAELGAGKTVLQKTIMNLIVTRDGGQFFSIDKSEDGEWGRFAETFPSHVVVDPDEPQWSMDPMRVIGGADGCELALSFLVYLLGLDIQGPLGRVLTRVMTPQYVADHKLEGLFDVVTELARLGLRGRRGRGAVRAALGVEREAVGAAHVRRLAPAGRHHRGRHGLAHALLLPAQRRPAPGRAPVPPAAAGEDLRPGLLPGAHRARPPAVLRRPLPRCGLGPGRDVRRHDQPRERRGSRGVRTPRPPAQGPDRRRRTRRRRRRLGRADRAHPDPRRHAPPRQDLGCPSSAMGRPRTQ